MASRLLLLILFSSMAMAMDIPSIQCDRDSDCDDGTPRGTHYCFMSMCERCIPCEQVLYRRSPSSEISGRAGCARTEEDCGTCLPGYQAEDLTNQRRSIKCYPLVAKDIATPALHHPSTRTVSVGVTMMSIIVLAIVALLIAAGGFFVLIKHYKSPMRTEPSSSNQSEVRKLVDRLPPPYEEEDEGEICGRVRASGHVYTVVPAQQTDHLNQATPIHPFHIQKIDSDMEDEDFLHVFQEIQPVAEDGNGSTETIPSQWEPTTADLHLESPPAGPTLTRSQSLELVSLHPVRGMLSSSGSDPTLAIDPRRRRSSGGESYAHRHVRLSMHRLPIAPVVLPAGESNLASCSSGQFEDDECQPPQSFVFEDAHVSTADVSTFEFNSSLLSFTGSVYGRPISSSTPTSNETGRGSRDSGFFDQSRRRPATDEMSFEFAVFFKRSRDE